MHDSVSTSGPTARGVRVRGKGVVGVGERRRGGWCVGDRGNRHGTTKRRSVLTMGLKKEHRKNGKTSQTDRSPKRKLWGGLAGADQTIGYTGVTTTT